MNLIVLSPNTDRVMVQGNAPAPGGVMPALLVNNYPNGVLLSNVPVPQQQGEPLNYGEGIFFTSQDGLAPFHGKCK